MNPRLFLLTGFGLGRLSRFPGTYGSLIPVAWAGLLHGSIGVKQEILDGSLLLITVIFSIVCVRFGREGEERLGGKDAQSIVADEIAGQALVLIALPWQPGQSTWNLLLAAVAFVWFRFFDILKPPPIRQLQGIPGGWGILSDDLLAALYAGIITQLTARFVLPAIVN